jgi:dTDP-4-amino-4,6-dideoxygalactose transaminase
MKRIPLLIPDLPSRGELAPYLERIDAARWYTNFGPLVRELEAALALGFSSLSGSPYIVSVANATLGLELALMALRLPPGSRVLVPALTFAASAAAILRSGLDPVLCDVEPDSWVLTPGIARAAASQTELAAVMPVATHGLAAPVDEWDRFSEQSGIRVVIDAAGAYGNQVQAGRCSAVFSLHATKSLGAGEGGFVVSTDSALIQEIKERSNFGIDLSNGDVTRLGTNAKLSEYHAAVALAALQGWPARRERRVAVHERYARALAHYCPSVTPQRRPPGGVYTILPVLLPGHAPASEVQPKLAALGIETRRWYCPTLEHHPAFREATVQGELRVARLLSERLLALPFHSFLSSGDIDQVCGALAAGLKRR